MSTNRHNMRPIDAVMSSVVSHFQRSPVDISNGDPRLVDYISHQPPLVVFLFEHPEIFGELHYLWNAGPDQSDRSLQSAVNEVTSDALQFLAEELQYSSALFEEAAKAVAMNRRLIPTATAATVPTPLRWGEITVVSVEVTAVPSAQDDSPPDGTVTLRNTSGTRIAIAQLDSTARARFELQDIGAGSFNWGVEYSGSTVFAPSRTTVTVNIDRAPTTTAVSLERPNVVAGDDAIVLVTVRDPSTNTYPTGAVTLTHDGISHGAPLDQHGRARIRISGVAAGAMALRARYTGAPNFEPSSDGYEHSVPNAPLPTTTTVSSSPTPARAGQDVTVHVHVHALPTAAQPDQSGTAPTGSVTLTLGSRRQTIELVDGTAQLVIPSPSAGQLSASAHYRGNQEFAPSTATTHTVTVERTTSDGAADVQLHRVLRTIPAWPPAGSPDLSASISLYRAILLGDTMGVNPAFDGLLSNWQDHSLPNISRTVADPDLLNTIAAELNRAAPLPVLERRVQISLRGLGVSVNVPNQPQTSITDRNTEFQRLWKQFRLAITQARDEAHRDQHAMTTEAILPIAQLIQVNLSETMTPDLVLQTQELSQEIDRRLHVLQSETLLTALNVDTWQEAVVALTKTAQTPLDLSTILKNGSVMESVTTALEWISLPSAAKPDPAQLDRLSNAIVTLNVLNGSTSPVPDSIETAVTGASTPPQQSWGGVLDTTADWWQTTSEDTEDLPAAIGR